jgi:sigma-B regulation protein RsbU (phosphoserine phosphatase)
MHRFSPRRLLVALRHTSPIDRVAITIVLLFIVFEVFSYAGRPLAYGGLVAFFAFLSLFYLLIRILPWVRSHVLWRLRYRLIAAYIFIAVVPLVLLLTMVGVASYLLYLELGAHLLHDDLDSRIGIITTDAGSIVTAIDQEIDKGASPDSDAVLQRPEVASLISAARAQWTDLQVFFNPGDHLSKLGDGEHFSGVVVHDGKIWFACRETRRADSKPVSVVVAAPVSSDLLDNLQSELGQVTLILFKPVDAQPAGGHLSYRSPQGQWYAPTTEISSRHRKLQASAARWDMKISGASILDATHLDPGGDNTPVPVFAVFELRPSALNRRLFSSVGELGPMLVLALGVVGVIFLALALAGLATGVVLTRTITRAVGDLHEATLHVRRGDFSHRIRVHQRDQLGDLAESFNEMASSVSDLIVEQGRRQRLENEVAIAREVQEQLFPRSLPSLPGLQLAAICRPARSVSGDYYDFIRLGPTRVGIALADISGKGIFAALLMASLQAALRSTASFDGKNGTAALVGRLNSHVFQNTADDRYATFFYSVYDTESHTLTYTNAGHLAPYFVTSEGVQQLDTGGTVIGMFEETNYTQGIVKVPPDSTLVAFSDGLTEPENVYGEEFGMQRVRDEILRHRATSPDRLAEFLIAAADQWAGTPEQADDITVVVAHMS